MKKILKRTLVILIYIGLILVNTKVYAVQTAKPAKDSVRMRKEATTNSSVVETLSSKDEVTILSKENNWYKVEYKKDGKTYSGYIREDMLKVNEETDENSDENVVANNEVNSSNIIENTQINGDNTTINNEVSNETQNDNEVAQFSENEESSKTTSAESELSSDKTKIQKGYSAKASGILEIKLLPTINSESISKIEADTEFTVTEVMNKWSYIETNEQEGWILTSKLEGTMANNDVAVNSQEQNNENESKNENEAENQAQSNPEEALSQVENVQTTGTSVEKQEENASTEKETESKNEAKNETKTKYVNAETLNIREKANSTAKVIGQLDLNAKVTLLETVDSTWSKIQANGVTGYVSSKFLSDTKTAVTSRSGDTSRESQETEKNQSQNQENSSSKQSNQATSSSQDTKQESQKSNDTSTANTSTSSKSGSSVVEYAKQYLGCKYVSGGTSPSGFDCSGFTTYVFKHFGISLSRTSGAQASNGTKVERSNLQAGDILIFNDSSNSKVGHVGIYIGGNQFIHAANPQKGVIISSLSESYYSARYVGARRVL